MIKIKAYFGDWKNVSADKALEFARSMWGRSNMPLDGFVKAFNTRHICGLTIKGSDLRK